MKALQVAPRATRRLAAYHEAGHAVASFFYPLAGATTRVTVREAELGEGDAGAHYGDGPPSVGVERDTVRSLSVVALAGSEVDRRLTGNAFTCGSSDYESLRQLLFRAYFDGEIEELVASVSPEEAMTRGLDEIAGEAAEVVEGHLKRLVDELRNEAHQLIESKWHHVEAVADALLQNGALDGDEVRHIIETGEQRESSR